MDHKSKIHLWLAVTTSDQGQSPPQFSTNPDCPIWEQRNRLALKRILSAFMEMHLL